MTSISPDNTSPLGLSADTSARGESGLRTALRLNAGFSLLTGLIATIAAGWVADRLGIEQTWLVRTIGIGLLGFAAGLVFISGLSAPVVRTQALQISIADFGWVAATIVVIAAGWLSTTGAIVMALIAVVVADFGLLQLWQRRRMGPITAG